MAQLLHSKHCQPNFLKEVNIFSVKPQHEGWHDRPQSWHETKTSALPVFLFLRLLPPQKSQVVEIFITGSGTKKLNDK